VVPEDQAGGNRDRSRQRRPVLAGELVELVHGGWWGKRGRVRRQGNAGCRWRTRWPTRNAGPRSFSRDFITIQSSSPCSAAEIRRGSVLRRCEVVGQRPRAGASSLGRWGARRLRLRGSSDASPPGRSRRRASLSKGVGAGQELVEEHAQRIDIAAGIDAELVSSPPASGLIVERPCRRAARSRCGACARWSDGPRALGDAEVDHLGHGPQHRAIVTRTLEGFRSTVDDPFLVRVLHRLADLKETARAAGGR